MVRSDFVRASELCPVRAVTCARRRELNLMNAAIGIITVLDPLRERASHNIIFNVLVEDMTLLGLFMMIMTAKKHQHH